MKEAKNRGNHNNQEESSPFHNDFTPSAALCCRQACHPQLASDTFIKLHVEDCAVRFKPLKAHMSQAIGAANAGGFRLAMVSPAVSAREKSCRVPAGPFGELFREVNQQTASNLEPNLWIPLASSCGDRLASGLLREGQLALVLDLSSLGQAENAGLPACLVRFPRHVGSPGGWEQRHGRMDLRIFRSSRSLKEIDSG